MLSWQLPVYKGLIINNPHRCLMCFSTLCKTYDNVSEGLRSLWQKAERRMAAACVNSTNYNTLTELHGDMVTVRPSATQNRIKEYDR